MPRAGTTYRNRQKTTNYLPATQDDKSQHRPTRNQTPPPHNPHHHNPHHHTPTHPPPQDEQNPAHHPATTPINAPNTRNQPLQRPPPHTPTQQRRDNPRETTLRRQPETKRPPQPTPEPTDKHTPKQTTKPTPRKTPPNHQRPSHNSRHNNTTTPPTRTPQHRQPTRARPPADHADAAAAAAAAAATFCQRSSQRSSSTPDPALRPSHPGPVPPLTLWLCSGSPVLPPRFRPSDRVPGQRRRHSTAYNGPAPGSRLCGAARAPRRDGCELLTAAGALRSPAPHTHQPRNRYRRGNTRTPRGGRSQGQPPPDRHRENGAGPAHAGTAHGADCSAAVSQHAAKSVCSEHRQCPSHCPRRL